MKTKVYIFCDNHLSELCEFDGQFFSMPSDGSVFDYEGTKYFLNSSTHEYREGKHNIVMMCTEVRNESEA